MMAPTWASACSRCSARDRPAIRIVPAEGLVRLTSIRITVVLPAPLWPRNPKAQPTGTVRFRSETAVRLPKRLVRPRVSMMGGAVVMRTRLRCSQLLRYRSDGRFDPRGSSFRPIQRRPGACVRWCAMSLSHRIAGRAETLSNLVVAVVLSAVLAADTAVTAARHDNWVFELTVGAIVGALALLRGRGRVLAAGASLAVAAAAAAAGDAAHLPSQPGVAAALPLLVLGAAAVRVAGRRAAVLIAISGVVVMVAGRVTLRPEYIAPASLG